MRSRRALAALLLALAAATAITACGESDSADPKGVPLFDPGEASFYRPPDDLVPEEPGRLVWVEPLSARPGMEAWRILYTSESPEGEIVTVSGLVASPEDEARERPIVVQAIGTVGLGDGCTFSTTSSIDNGTDLQLNVLSLLTVSQGWIGVSTDLPGLDTPGTHTYLVGESNGRAMLDAARAVRELKEARAGKRVAVLGGSEGGHASLFAGQLAPDYAPGLELEGAVAWAPASHLERYKSGGNAAPIPGFFVMVALGIGQAHGLDPGKGLNDHDRRLLDRVADACTGTQKDFPTIGELVSRFDDQAFVERGPFDRQPWKRLLEQQEPGLEPTAAPILIVQGDEDPVVPPSATRALFSALCARGDQAELEVIPGAGHVGGDPDFNQPAGESSIAWLEDRFEREPAPSNCS
jgi:acetyl esterase/lipase